MPILQTLDSQTSHTLIHMLTLSFELWVLVANPNPTEAGVSLGMCSVQTFPSAFAQFKASGANHQSIKYAGIISAIEALGVQTS